ncbi:DUF3105 domain-containing protein [Yinghuangia soli]|uniref:DUF3105 domain-containing protein n=1 Tax=Yinghuangia soli TaxID=2908204 RepID=A0AA41Q035_9ACTN|nr:DUF3105 domain-containing protein [Yinghuangia soli]MCF2529008.1 DUF3105 domain-containing protein [Yinghuangia soli]
MGPQSGTSKKQTKNAKMAAARQRVAEQREREAKAARRRSIIIGSTAALVAGGVIAGLAAVVLTEDDKGGSSGGSIVANVKPAGSNGGSPIQGVTAWVAEQGHEPNKSITYEQVPPVGGEHHPTWLNCGIYSKPVPQKNAVHSLEHGAVWITYSPTLPADQLEKLKAFAKQDYMLLSPHEGMSSPITLSSWALQLKVDNADDPRIKTYIDTYRNNKDTTPEYGASCSGGTGKPE